MANTPVNHVDIESALTAIAIRADAPVTAAHLSQRLGLQQGCLRGQPQQWNSRQPLPDTGFSRTTSTWPTRCSSALIR